MCWWCQWWCSSTVCSSRNLHYWLVLLFPFSFLSKILLFLLVRSVLSKITSVNSLCVCWFFSVTTCLDCEPCCVNLTAVCMTIQPFFPSFPAHYLLLIVFLLLLGSYTRMCRQQQLLPLQLSPLTVTCCSSITSSLQCSLLSVALALSLLRALLLFFTFVVIVDCTALFWLSVCFRLACTCSSQLLARLAAAAFSLHLLIANKQTLENHMPLDEDKGCESLYVQHTTICCQLFYSVYQTFGLR